MRKEIMFQNFLKEPLLYEKGYLKKEDLENISLFDKQTNKILELIRLIVINQEQTEQRIKNIINGELRG